MNPVITTVFDFEIRWYSVLILVGATVGYLLAKREAKKFKFNTDFLFNMFFYCIIFGIIGARLYYCLFNWASYADNPISILYIWEGGLAIHGGIIGGFLTMYLYCKKYNVSLVRTLDFVTPSLLIGQAIGRWGNFFNSEAHGAATTLASLQAKHIPEFIINGMYINGMYYEPTFLYESVWCLIGFLIMVLLRFNKKLRLGNLTAFYLIWYGIGRLYIEGLRTDSLMIGGYRVAQIISIVMIIVGVLWTMILSRKSKYEDLYNAKAKEEIRF